MIKNTVGATVDYVYVTQKRSVSVCVSRLSLCVKKIMRKKQRPSLLSSDQLMGLLLDAVLHVSMKLQQHTPFQKPVLCVRVFLFCLTSN